MSDFLSGLEAIHLSAVMGVICMGWKSFHQILNKLNLFFVFLSFSSLGHGWKQGARAEMLL